MEDGIPIQCARLADSNMIHINNVRVRYGSNIEALRGVTCTIDRGKFYVIVGPSGSGKSTLLRVIAGLEMPTSGAIDISTPDYATEHEIGVVFQDAILYPNFSVRKNITFYHDLNSKDRITDIVIDSLVRRLQISHLLDRKPSQLSGGERQRVAIARAIIRNPSIFLLDEPLSSLDLPLRRSVRDIISNEHSNGDMTTIVISHDDFELLRRADKVIVMNKGAIEQFGNLYDITHFPKSKFVLDFFSRNGIDSIPYFFIGKPLISSSNAKDKEYFIDRTKWRTSSTGVEEICVTGTVNNTIKRGELNILQVVLRDGTVISPVMDDSGGGAIAVGAKIKLFADRGSLFYF